MLGRLLWGRAGCQRIFHGPAPNRRGTAVRKADAPSTVQLWRASPDDGPVEEAAPELDVLVGAARERKDDLADDLVRVEGRRPEGDEEVLGPEAPLVGHDLGVEHQREGR